MRKYNRRMRALAAALVVIAAPALAAAQQTPPPPPPTPGQTAPPIIRERPVSGFVVDARGVLAKFGLRPLTAQALGVKTAEIPGPGLGVAAGAHVFPVRLGRVAIGIGGELMLASRSRALVDAQNEPTGVVLRSRAYSLAPQVSLNFGRHTGWSYISGGIGTASFETWNDEDARPERRLRAINYGGGARWFASPHFAFTVDLRFYRMPTAAATTTLAERPGQRLMVLSAGLSVR